LIAWWTDSQVLERIQRLAWEAHGLYAKNPIDGLEGQRLRKIRIELDRCWDMLRRRLALPDAGNAADDVQARASEIGESHGG
jgi:Protein of unknown function (DUF2630)